MIKTEVAFLEGRLFSIQSDVFEYVTNCSWLAGYKPALQKSHFCLDHVNRLLVTVLHLLQKHTIHVIHTPLHADKQLYIL